MYIIVGLGNPGQKYENTRHNMGFLCLDLIAEKLNIKVDKLKFKALVGEGRVADQKVLLVKPQTYMNLSGESVRDIMNFYKEPIENLIVISDDIDLETGSFRIRKKGSAGTHNGLRNIVYLLQDDNFPRIRVGVGAPEKGDLVNYVTGGIPKSDVELLEGSLLKASEAAIFIVTDGVDKAMNQYNIRPKRAKKEKEEKETKEELDAHN